jgi:septal ring factor EnvC (AmiA/AmiB activator)
MASPSIPSAALVRTARNEIERVERGIARTEQRRDALVAQLQELDDELAGYAHRKKLLEELVYVEQAAPVADVVSAKQRPSKRAIKGAELRRIAGHLLWSSHQEQEMHYREWFERMLAAGFAIGGKDPVASFLTNVRESPAVERGSKQGYYKLNPNSLDRVAQELNEAEAELADLEHSISRAYAVTTTGDPVHPETLRKHRTQLKQRLKRLEAMRRELRFIFSDESNNAGAHINKALQAA